MKLNDEILKNNPFRVPDDYFDTLADRTMAAIDKEAGKDGKRAVINMKAGKDGKRAMINMEAARDGERAAKSEENIRKPGRVIRLKPFMALAAAILGFAILATALVRLINADRPGMVTDSGHSLYADLIVEEIDTYMLEDELHMTDPAIPEMTMETIESEAIIDYLMTEDITLDDIYELL